MPLSLSVFPFTHAPSSSLCTLTLVQPCPLKHNCSSSTLLSLFEPERLSPTLIASIQAPMLILHSNHVPLSAAIHPPPQPCLFEPKCSSPTPTASLQAQTFISHLYRVHSSSNAHPPLQLCLLEHNCSSSTPTMSI